MTRMFESRDPSIFPPPNPLKRKCSVVVCVSHSSSSFLHSCFATGGESGLGTHALPLGDVGQNLPGDLPKLSNHFQALPCLSPSEVSFTMIFLSCPFLCCFSPSDPPPNLARALDPSLLSSAFCSETSHMGLTPQICTSWKPDN